jgi:hypothetical protein
MTVTVFYGAKGGQGTSVVAATYALFAARAGRVLLIDGAPGADLTSIVATDVPGLCLVGDELGADWTNPDRWLDPLADFDQIVVDAGRAPADFAPPPGARFVLVVRNDYLALRAATARSHPATTGVVLISESDRALRRRDIDAALSPLQVVCELDFDQTVGRAVDAGLLATRIPAALHGLTPGLVP